MVNKFKNIIFCSFFLVLFYAESSLAVGKGFGGLSLDNNVQIAKINSIELQHCKDRLEQEGQIKLLIRLKTKNIKRNSVLNNHNTAEQRLVDTQELQKKVIDHLKFISGKSYKKGTHKYKHFKHTPYMALSVDSIEFEELLGMPEIFSIEEDKLYSPTLMNSIPQIGADVVWNEGFSGAGQAVAILDTGVDGTHPFLANKIVAEACFSTNSSISTSLCVNGSKAKGSGSDCTGVGGCLHGTHVAGIVAGSGANFSGVAKSANIISVQVYSKFSSSTYCKSTIPCILAYTSDIIQGLEYVYSLRNTYNIAAVNLSLGAGGFSTALSCDNSNLSTKAIIDLLRSVDIATVIAAGNEGFSSQISSPGCISSAISVGAIDSLDQVVTFSNAATWLSLLAPGVNIYSSIPGNNFSFLSGTSMATPHVSGAFAVLKSKKNNASVSQLLAAMSLSGTAIIDNRNGGVFSSLDLAIASNALSKSQLPVNLILDNDYKGSIQQGSFVSNLLLTAYAGSTLVSSSNLSRYRFTPNIPVSGFYRVYAWWGTNGSYSSKVLYSINHSNNKKDVLVNQLTNSKQWNDLGVYEFSVGGNNFIEISNSNGGIAAADAIRLELINNPKSSLLITTSILIDAVIGSEYNVKLNAAGGNGGYTWSLLRGSLPNGLVLSNTGVISGVPTVQGVVNFTVQVSDGLGNSSSTDLMLSVGADTNLVFIDDFSDGTLAPWNELFSKSISVVQDNGNWVILKSGVSDPNGGWVGLNNTISDFEIVLYTKRINNIGGRANRYSITDSQGNGYGFYLHFRDSKLTIEKRTRWVATELSKSTALTGTAIVGDWYTMRLSRKGLQLVAEVYKGRVNPLNVQPDLQLVASDTNFFNFTQMNINGGYEYYTDNIRIHNITNSVLPVVVTTDALPNAFVGKAYTENINVIGGEAPYTWSLSSGALPSGLLLSSTGKISGTPTTVGLSSFSLKVIDNLGIEVITPLSIKVDASIVLSENFENGLLSNWSQLFLGAVQLNTNSIDGTYLKKITNSDPNGSYILLDKSITDFDVILHTRRLSSSGGGNANRYSLTDKNGNGYGIYFHYKTNKLVIEKRSLWKGIKLIESNIIPGGAILNQWYTMHFVRKGAGLLAQLFLGKVKPVLSTPVLEISVIDTAGAGGSFSKFNINGGFEFDTDNIVVVK